ncbi:MAG: helix-turn-helix domain-containing protein [Desulfovibrio sp.]|jgi:transcriptional regulator with XRE-family HTH domain|nr:helix-turn-helix domain-containing protein [Desulfovibrio sp.]
MPKTIEFLAEQLKRRRKKAKLTQDEFAEQLGLSLTLIRDIERKKANPTLLTLDRLAAYFNISTAELIDVDDIVYNEDHIRKLIHDEVEHLSIQQLKILISLIHFTQD